MGRDMDRVLTSHERMIMTKLIKGDPQIQRHVDLVLEFNPTRYI